MGDADVIVPMVNDKGVLYTAEVTVGTPAKKFMMDLDTGSSDMWVSTELSSLWSWIMFRLIFGFVSS